MKKIICLIMVKLFLFSLSISACDSEIKIPEYEVLENVQTIEHFGESKYTFILVSDALTKKQIDLLAKEIIKKYPERYFYLYSDKETIKEMQKHIQEDRRDYDLTDIMKKNWIGSIDDRSGEYRFFPLFGYDMLN